MTLHTTRRALLGRIGAGSGVSLGAALAGCTGDGGGDGGDDGTVVEMTGALDFDPNDLTVETGTTVTWENVGSVVHTVTAYDGQIPDDASYFASGGFDSEEAARDGFTSGGDVGADETYEHTFEVAGTYEYFCIPHEQAGMTGTVTVEE